MAQLFTACLYINGNIASTVLTTDMTYKGITVAANAVILITAGLINTVGVKALGFLCSVSVVFNIVGLAAVVITVVALTPTRVPIQVLFETWNNQTFFSDPCECEKVMQLLGTPENIVITDL